jgi:hypothetical protein
MASVVVSAATESSQSNLAKDRGPREANIEVPLPVTQLSPKPTGIGTKDAPVDGKDGKPKVGPFVSTEKDRKKQKPDSEDGELVTKKPGSTKDASTDTIIVDGKVLPEVNDGVMNDPSRQKPKEGTTGTEGGVSEKDKVQKAQEGQTGEKVEKKPDPPKEAPPLPHSEQEKITQGEKEAAKKADKDAVKKTKGKDGEVDVAAELSGIEVCPSTSVRIARNELTW